MHTKWFEYKTCCSHIVGALSVVGRRSKEDEARSTILARTLENVALYLTEKFTNGFEAG